MYTARIDSGHTYKQPGPTFGFNGVLRLELLDSAPPGTTASRQSLVRESVRATKFWQIGYSASIVTKEGSPYNMAHSEGLANGVNEVVACRSQTAVQGRFRMQGLDECDVYYLLCANFRQGRFLLYSKPKYFSNRQQQQQQSKSKAVAAPPPQIHGTSGVLEVVQGPRAVFPQSGSTQHHTSHRSEAALFVPFFLLSLSWLWRSAKEWRRVPTTDTDLSYKYRVHRRIAYNYRVIRCVATG